MPDKTFERGDNVQWKSHGQNVKGTVQEKNPQYRVASRKTGADAVHKPDALRPDK